MEFIWDAAVLEGNPLSFCEIKTLVDGVTVGGRKVSDQQQILNLVDGHRRLLSLLKSRQFIASSKTIFSQLNEIIVHGESIDSGCFRGEGRESAKTPVINLGKLGHYTPISTSSGASELNRVFQEGISALNSLVAFEKAAAYFLFGALQQFFFDGNKRTSRLMMNGVLMSHGIDAISFPAAKADEFKDKMLRFYSSKDGTEMMRFIFECHPEADTAIHPVD
ncbi:Fic family protein [Aliidiomarina halalkaliphila]|uniref:Fic family protein n=1 Tax=Aliidiomarina halalkaliphila TaxID=2593535 RepID=UPI001C8F6DA9|nr:Fic family protein [Aliidiomarina halalkaliphila]